MPVTHISGTDDGVVVVDCKAPPPIDVIPRSCYSGPEKSQPPLLIEQLLSELRAAFNAEKDAGYVIDNNQDPASFNRLNQRVVELLKCYATTNRGDWHRFALFNDLHYVRNLVEANDDFELIVLCWKGGQVSRVHNHATSHCWLTVLDGEMREVQYQRTDPPAAAASAVRGGDGSDEKPGDTVYVEATRTTDLRIGDVGYVSDHLGLHTVGCHVSPEQLAEWQQTARNGFGSGADSWQPEGGVTLHLYSPPIRRVKIYEDNTVSERTPGFYSRGGVRV
ncbi:cysteine dioxygenase [Volvox carteri f. nagariensis]|uniref:Cysteine dioxygenase n=1 Tax=Volvox carteri f. nagariensis TaxID=3068 RepID=D8TKK1_VOLCA|nr:cysteine dioxygenase [Volvox carteri f. nagariensis]EFJ51902.1 cysteine dioxygenase [Volvox carteri f. nagariensis]|eukprot:XP_002946676.1 cysteine dioxygenase [Volvox carteri f. nagariensis]